ncbi:MAG TPA: trehalose-phosphatase, partial [Acidimicrobiia bacterium]
THACFAGDDRGDLDAFAALARLQAEGRLETAVRIAVGSAEAPPELLARADLVVDGPAGLVSVLEALGRAATRTPR